MLERFKGWLTGLVVGVAIVLCLLTGVAAVDTFCTTEVENYTEGFEITKMELGQVGNNYGLMMVRNDHDCTILRVNLDTFAMYDEGEVVEVEVRVMESVVTGSPVDNVYKLVK